MWGGNQVRSSSVGGAAIIGALGSIPGMPHLVPIIVGLWMLVAATVAGSVVVPMSLVGDLADYEALRSGQRAAGPMVAITQMTQKLFGGGAAAGAGAAAVVALGSAACSPQPASRDKLRAMAAARAE